MKQLFSQVVETLNQILKGGLYENGYTREEILRREEQKKEFRKALKACTNGDMQAHNFLISHIKEILVGKYKVSRENIDQYIPFHRLEQLTDRIKFEILLYSAFNEYKEEGLSRMIQKYNLDKPYYDQQGIQYRITSDILGRIYEEEQVYLNFTDKLEILSRIIYQDYKGNSVIDTLLQMRIDGISAGVSGQQEESESTEGIPRSCDSVWIFYRGKSIYLPFLGFGSNRELIRVCKNVCSYNQRGQLSEVKGFIVNEMKDGSRIAVARPPFSENWVLFIRKFDTVSHEGVEELITDKGKELVIKYMEFIVKGCQVTAITGAQGAGKTTLLMALVGFIPPAYSIRVQELSFELHLRKIYPERNIVSFQETASVSGEKALEFTRKTEGMVSILGEVASVPVASRMIDMAQAAFLFTMFTHHARTAKGLILSLRNALLADGKFYNEKIAAEQVVQVVAFDIHLQKNMEGHRYVERITEIIGEDNGKFQTRDLIIWEKGEYKVKYKMTKEKEEEILSHLTERDREEFCRRIEQWEELCDERQKGLL